MVTAISDEQLEHVLQGVKLPPQPATLMAILREKSKPEPSMQNISTIVSRDVGMSGAVLKTINSPFYGMRREIDSISQAISLLGMSNIINLVTALSLKSALMAKGSAAQMEKYWETSTNVALVSVMISKRLSIATPDEVYTVGLFHDCGMPLLAQKFSDYFDSLQEFARGNSCAITEFEEQRYTTSHAVIGYYLCKSWGVSDSIREVVLTHHSCEQILQDSNDVAINQLMSVLKLAEHIVHVYDSLNEDLEWPKIKVRLLDYLSLSVDEYEDLEKDAHDFLE